MIEEYKNLRKFNTFMIPVIARYFSRINNVKEALDTFNSKEWKLSGEHIILGGGSNILFTKDYDGFVLKNEIKGIEIIEENENEVLVKVGAGENWHQFVMWSVERGFWGIENLVYIPGTVGAAPVQNIGAYGVEVASSIDAVEYITFSNLENRKISSDHCDFSYRSSFFKKNAGKNFITYVYFRLQKNGKAVLDYGSVKDTLEEKGIFTPKSLDIAHMIIEIRKSKLPEVGDIGTAGSFFKNPIISHRGFEKLKNKFPDIKYFDLENKQKKISAGWLLDTLGYKGVVNGNVGNYKNHALIITHNGNGTGKEIYEYIQNIMKRVKDEFDITLEPEVVIVL